MNSFLKKLIEILLLTVIGAFFLVFVFRFFDITFFGSSEIPSGFIGAFTGAFFAFLFVRLGDGLSKIYERRLKHYNALVTLERKTNVYLGIISNNIFVIDDFLKVMDDIVTKGKPAIYFNTLHEFVIDEKVGLDLHNLDLINQLFSFEVGVEKMNHSIASTNRFYSDIKVAFIEKNIDFAVYQANVALLKEKLEELRKFLVSLEKESKELCAVVRLLMKDKPLLTRIVHIFLKKRVPRGLKEQIPQEIKRIEEEIETVQKESKTKIDSLLAHSEET